MVGETGYKELVLEVKSKIPKEEMRRIYSLDTFDYEIGGSDEFLGFLNIYDMARDYMSEDIKTVIDFGCCMAPQGYMFSDKEKYIGIDSSCGIGSDGLYERFCPDNAEHFVMSIQDYIKTHADKHDKKEVFAICSYVPDEEVWPMVEEAYDNCYIYYPGETNVLKVNGKYLIKEKKR